MPVKQSSNRNTNIIPNLLIRPTVTIIERKSEQKQSDHTYIVRWWLSTSRTILCTFCFIFLAALAIIIGVPLVYFNFSRQPGPNCTLTLRVFQQLSTRNDSHPYSAAIGDFNNDGQLDIAIANSNADNVGIFLGNGDGTFEDQVTYATGYRSSPYYIALGDFNNDQHLDMAVANFGTHNIGIFLGKGNGSFTEQIKFPTLSSRPQWIAVGHFDNDTQLDIVVVNYGTNSISVMLGNGEGSFIMHGTFSTGYDSLPNSVAVGDFNSDNKSDIAVANYGTDNVGVFLGYGNGSFKIQATFSTGVNSYPYSIALADLNNDNLLDIVVTNSGTSNVGFLSGLGDGTFSKQITFSTGAGSKPQSLAINHLNRDVALDIIVANYAANNVGVFFGMGNGTFKNQTTFDIGYRSSPHAIACGDFNKNGRMDIVVIDNVTSRMYVLRGYDDITFSHQTMYSTGLDTSPSSVAVDDFNRDGRLDIVVANFAADNIGIFLGYGNGSFSNQTSYVTGSNSSPYSIALGDFNNDRQLDIVVANYGANNIGIFLGYGNGSFANQTNYSTGDDSGPYSVAVHDFNEDSRLDIVVADLNSGNVSIFLGNGDGTFLDQQSYSIGPNSQPASVAVGDLNNDHHSDIVVAIYNADSVGIFWGNGDGTFSDLVPYFMGAVSGPYSVAVGDLNNDSYPDIAVANRGTYTVGLLFGSSYGNFSMPPMTLTCDGFLYSVTIDDMNNDSKLDIIVANYGSSSVGVFLGYGNGTFMKQRTFPTGNDSRPISVAVGDFNHDNWDDIAVANSQTSNVGIFLGLSVASFESSPSINTGSSPLLKALAISDFNNDSALDIVVANLGYDTISVLLGSEDGSFPIQREYQTGSSSLPAFVAIDHLNNDSWLDIAVVNSGTNNVGILLGYGNGSFLNLTAYSTGINSDPQSIATGDFNNDAKCDIVVANYGTSNVFVFLKFNSGSFRNEKTYPTGDQSNPRSIAIGDFNNDARLDIVAGNYGSNTISVFLGYGNGSFANQVNYSTGDDSLPSSVAIGDFNEDSRLDIVVANSNYGNVSIFLGNGDGTFLDQQSYSIGPEWQPVSVAVGDLNNDHHSDIVVANSNAFTVSVLLGNGDGSFSEPTNCWTGVYSSPTSVTTGDFDNDTRLDIVVANYHTNKIGIFLGYGNGSFSDQVTYSTGSSPSSVATGDFNEDSRLDIVVTNYDSGDIGVFFGYGDGTFSNQTVYNLTVAGSKPYSVAVGQFNNDSWLDIAVVDLGTNNLHIFLGYINGTFFSPIVYPTGNLSELYSLAVGDFNSDKHLDIAITSSATNQIGVFLGYTSEDFLRAPEHLIEFSSDSINIAVGHFDGDTFLDIAVVNSGTDSVTILLGSGYGTFSNQKSYSTGTGSNPCWVVVADFNNDSRLDLAVANSGTHNIGILFGYGNGTFSSPKSFSTGKESIPYSLAVIDINNDTQLDIVVANYGSNDISVFHGHGDGSFMRGGSFPTEFGSGPIAVAASVLNKDVFLFGINNGTSDIDIISKTC